MEKGPKLAGITTEFDRAPGSRDLPGWRTFLDKGNRVLLGNAPSFAIIFNGANCEPENVF